MKPLLMIWVAFMPGLAPAKDEPAARTVSIDCKIELQADGKRVLVSSPKVGTLLGRPAQVSMAETDSKGQPAVAILVSLTPGLDGEEVKLQGSASIQLAGTKETMTTVAATREVVVELPASADKAYVVSCGAVLQ